MVQLPSIHNVPSRAGGEVELALTAALLTDRGRELLDRLAGGQVGPDRALELARSLRERYPPGLVAAALPQQALRTAARAKFSRAEQMLFTRAGLEQASSEITVAHSAARYAAATLVADLCCGRGGNVRALGWGGGVIAVDFDHASLEFARHNADVYGASGGLAAVCADVADIALAGVDAVFIDPARRSGGRRLAAGRSEPPLGWCLGLAGGGPPGGGKAAPGVPPAPVPAGRGAGVVAVGRDP